MGCVQSNTNDNDKNVTFDDTIHTANNDLDNTLDITTLDSPIGSPLSETRILDNGTKYKLHLWERDSYLQQYAFNELYECSYELCNELFNKYTTQHHNRYMDKRSLKKLSTHCCIRIMHEYYITQKTLQPNINNDKLIQQCQYERMYILPLASGKISKLSKADDNYYIQCMMLYIGKSIGFNKHNNKISLNKFNTTWPTIAKDIFDANKTINKNSDMQCVIQ